MKLIAIYHTTVSTCAMFSIEGQEMYLYKSGNYCQVTDKDDNPLDFTEDQCKDILVNLNKQKEDV